jgi:hypothetical protein
MDLILSENEKIFNLNDIYNHDKLYEKFPKL